MASRCLVDVFREKSTESRPLRVDPLPASVSYLVGWTLPVFLGHTDTP